MRHHRFWNAWIVLALIAGNGSSHADVVGATHATTAGAIAIANLGHQIAQHGDDVGVEELLMTRSRFLGDYDALDRAVFITEGRAQTRSDLLRRARTRSATHRFADALADVAAAERAGANNDEVTALRVAIQVATGHADGVLAQLEIGVRRDPGFASFSALAGAYAEVDRLADADLLYLAALADLDTTSPFPYAWIYFARGVMWAEQGGDPVRGEALYRRAIAHLPQFATATIHLAELEAARGDLPAAIARLERIVASSNEPEALALLGALYLRSGDRLRGARAIASAQQRYESLLALHPWAFADHAAEFYLGSGADAERAWVLAQRNLAARETVRAFGLAIEAAEATGRRRDACGLAARARVKFGQAAASACVDVP